ncbi:hypothetical protein [Faecalibacterium prausnitzii]|uniref:hypothetical protein n=1 Tax=Faecalibacterium prausnitzii TaxID=853 RepID=UPI0022E1C925|nr:hypothetical protein [Faecalibacterium prausnitzii]
MNIKGNAPVFRKVPNALAFFWLVMALFFAFPLTASATIGRTTIAGTVYQFEKDDHYNFSDSQPISNAGTYGTFAVYGNLSSAGQKDGISAYITENGQFELFYTYQDSLLNTTEDSWHLVDDKSKKIDKLTLDSKIMKGAIVVQTSNDHINWRNVQVLTNAFQDVPVRANAIYSATAAQLDSGCFYRVIIAYEVSIRTEERKVLFVNTDKYETRKYAEVYEVYAQSKGAASDSVNKTQARNPNEAIRVKDFDNYYGTEDISPKDIHYGWTLGHFIVSGFTRKEKNPDNTLVFLKNAGDQVKLSFHLEQDITALNGNPKLTITDDTNGRDQYFQTEKMDFGRGLVIVRYTDDTYKKSKPIYYRDYLKANATGADTEIQLCEEGDYEVALDYEVTKDELIDKVGHYRITFNFSVRNGNSMFFPMDLATGAELVNGSVAENGFRIDMAKSRYLSIDVKYSVLNPIGDSYVEDTRFNRPAKDGNQYTDEGIYTITARSDYSEEPTVKKIIVGNDFTALAYVVNNLSLDDFNQKLKDGFTIDSDGVLLEPTSVSVVSSSGVKEPVVEQPAASSAPESTVRESEQPVQEVETPSSSFSVITVVGIVILVAVVAVLLLKKKKPDASDTHGGADE